MHSFFSRIFFRSDPQSQIITKRSKRIGFDCFSTRAWLFSLILFKAFLMALWIFRGNFLVNRECIIFGWSSSTFLSDEESGGDIVSNDDKEDENEIIVLKRKDYHLKSDPFQYSLRNSKQYSDGEERSTVIAGKNVAKEIRKSASNEDKESKRQRRFVTAFNSAEKMEFIRFTSTSKPNKKKIRILKIVRQPLHKNLRINRTFTPKRYWRNVEQTPIVQSNKGEEDEMYTAKRRHVKTVVRIVPFKKLDTDGRIDDNSEHAKLYQDGTGGWISDYVQNNTSEDRSRHLDTDHLLQTKTTRNKMRRIKVIKRRRKLKIPKKVVETQRREIEHDKWDKSRPDKRYSGQDFPLTATSNITALPKVENEDVNTSVLKAMRNDAHNMYETREEENFPTVNVPYDKEEETIDRSPRPDSSPQPHSTTPRISYTTSELLSSNFVAQFDAFKTSALCVTCALFDAWCCVQFAALLLFAVGILRDEMKVQTKKCLLMPHLILDAIFLVILLVYAITITVFGCVLFALIKEMLLRDLTKWILIATVLMGCFILYMTSFGLTLRGFKILLHSSHNASNSTTSESLIRHNDKRKFTPRQNRHKSDSKTGDHFSQQYLMLNQVIDV